MEKEALNTLTHKCPTKIEIPLEFFLLEHTLPSLKLSKSVISSPTDVEATIKGRYGTYKLRLAISKGVSHTYKLKQNWFTIGPHHII